MARFPCAGCGTPSQFNKFETRPWRNEYFAFFVCVFCAQLLVATWAQTGDEESAVIIWPVQRGRASSDIPDAVRPDLDEALRALNTGLWKSSLMAARGALQAAMRQQGAAGASLNDQIQDLAARHVVPPALADWAHEVRLAGNLAAHPAPGQAVAQAEAEEVLALAESIFDYLYVVPAAVRRRHLSPTVP